MSRKFVRMASIWDPIEHNSNSNINSLLIISSTSRFTCNTSSLPQISRFTLLILIIFRHYIILTILKFWVKVTDHFLFLSSSLVHLFLLNSLFKPNSLQLPFSIILSLPLIECPTSVHLSLIILLQVFDEGSILFAFPVSHFQFCLHVYDLDFSVQLV